LKAGGGERQKRVAIKQIPWIRGNLWGEILGKELTEVLWERKKGGKETTSNRERPLWISKEKESQYYRREREKRWGRGQSSERV